MGKKLAVVTFGLAVLCASQSWAGSSGPGWASRQTGAQNQAPIPAAKARYTYCVGGGMGTSYFSSVITSALGPPLVKPNQDSSLEHEFDAYLKTMHVLNQGSTCITSLVMADIVRGRKQREDESAYMKYKIVETNWTGNQ